MTVRKLRPDEWNFDRVSDDRARGVFLYEYFRYSDKCRKLVLRLRKIDNPCMCGEWLEGYKPMTIERRELLRKEVGGATFEKLAEALMNCPQFPRTPALKLRDQDWIRDLQRTPAVRSCSGEIVASQSMKNATDQIVGKPGIEYRFKGSVKAMEFESVFPLIIDWRKPDAQIAEDFRVRVLSLRTEQFWKVGKISPTQAAIGNLADKLPFKPLTALIWLGVLRRFEAADEDWGKYFEFYDGEMRKKLEKQDSGFESRRRKCLRDCERARKILAWLETGAKEKLARAQFR
jgi:hypothetical protein